MGWMLRAYVDLCWVPEGSGFVTVMPAGGLSNEPGFGAAWAAGPEPNAQMMRFQVSEPVAAVSGVSSGTLSTALGTAASQLGTDLTTFLQTSTALATALGWATGQP